MARKSAFAFALGQRINVPGKKNVQGVVSLPRCVNEFCVPPSFQASTTLSPFIFIRWLGDDGEPAAAWFAEPDVETANSPLAEDGPVFIAEPIKRRTRKPARHRKSRR